MVLGILHEVDMTPTVTRHSWHCWHGGWSWGLWEAYEHMYWGGCLGSLAVLTMAGSWTTFGHLSFKGGECGLMVCFLVHFSHPIAAVCGNQWHSKLTSATLSASENLTQAPHLQRGSVRRVQARFRFTQPVQDHDSICMMMHFHIFIGVELERWLLWPHQGLWRPLVPAWCVQAWYFVYHHPS